ncbi:hypothetical protein AKJ16_DCAP13994, partial [Drosera capensis]
MRAKTHSPSHPLSVPIPSPAQHKPYIPLTGAQISPSISPSISPHRTPNPTTEQLIRLRFERVFEFGDGIERGFEVEGGEEVGVVREEGIKGGDGGGGGGEVGSGRGRGDGGGDGGFEVGELGEEGRGGG